MFGRRIWSRKSHRTGSDLYSPPTQLDWVAFGSYLGIALLFSFFLLSFLYPLIVTNNLWALLSFGFWNSTAWGLPTLCTLWAYRSGVYAGVTDHRYLIREFTRAQYWGLTFGFYLLAPAALFIALLLAGLRLWF